MKKLFILPVLLCLSGCGPGLWEMPCLIELPEFPPHWKEVFGEIRWRLEWINPRGGKEVRELAEGGRMEISVMPEWPSPVLARPFVSGRVRPGLLKAAGAIFPHDVSGNSLILSWQGGVDASFYWELAAASESLAAELSAQAAKRRPQYFDWPRFRALFTEGVAAEDIRADPWLAGWKDIARKTVQSGFNSRYISAENRTDIAVPGCSGLWTGTSPFAAPIIAEDGAVFPARQEADIWYSAARTLVCTTETWILKNE
jgi:hypothetical protein